ncbi:hypothetical protein ONZ45_g2851 [Pleurotus djamor]|nr:hypothetical protein ONZ45_g2851 [Pleurotus djamor]
MESKPTTDRGCANLNKSVLRQISKALERDPSADIESVLEKVYVSYASLRRKIRERQTKRTSQKCVSSSDRPDPPLGTRTLSVFAPFGNVPFAISSLEVLKSLPLRIIHPLEPKVLEILDTVDKQDSGLCSRLLRCIFNGSVIWECDSRAVIQVGNDVVVKVAERLEHDEHAILQFVQDHFPSIVAPRPLGLSTIGSVSFMFMTHIPGATLESRWPTLTLQQRIHITQVLDVALKDLRSLKLPEGSPLGSPVGLRLCKDVRRDERVSKSPIYSEDEFNDFLMNPQTSRAAIGFKRWLRPMLQSDHEVVFTHADFHPRNIMVLDAPDETVQLSGILDWETSGFYPEYWELLKALNTRSVRDDSTWWDHLPPCILGYNHEVVLDRVIESTVIY